MLVEVEVAVFVALDLPRTSEWRYSEGMRMRGAAVEYFTLAREVDTTPRVIWRADQPREGDMPKESGELRESIVLAVLDRAEITATDQEARRKQWEEAAREAQEIADIVLRVLRPPVPRTPAS